MGFKERLSLRVSPQIKMVIDILSKSLSKSNVWVVENAILVYGKQVEDYLSIDVELRNYLDIKCESWKDDLRSDVLRYHLSKGFMLKNSVRMIFNMIVAGVEKVYILNAIEIYKKLCTSKDYVELLDELKNRVETQQLVNIEEYKRKLELLTTKELN